VVINELKLNSMSMQTENNYPPPSLSPSLSSVYSSLSPEMQKIFIRVFRFLWNYVSPLRKFTSPGGVLYSYWAVDMHRVKIDLTPSELSMLTYLYQVTCGGISTIHSDIVYNSAILPHILKQSKQGILNDLKHRGYITRLTRDPSAPYLQRSISRQPVFIRLTSKGVGVILGIEKDLYRLLYNTSLNELTGANKKL
jgi:hypothetical protein